MSCCSGEHLGQQALKASFADIDMVMQLGAEGFWSLQTMKVIGWYSFETTLAITDTSVRVCDVSLRGFEKAGALRGAQPSIFKRQDEMTH